MIDIADIRKAKFVDGGRTIHEIDCWGLVMIVMKRFNKHVPDFKISCYDVDGINQIKLFVENKFVKTDKLFGGMIVAMRMDREHPEYTQHFGVSIDHKRFLHILDKTGVIISSVNDSIYKNIISGYYDWMENI